MKKLLLSVLALMCVGANVFAGDITVKLGVDFASNFLLDAGGIPDVSTNQGVTIAAEYNAFRTEKFFAGIGGKYMLDRKVNLSSFMGDEVKTGALPLYIYGAITPAMFGVKTSENVVPYLKVDVGYIAMATDIHSKMDTTGKWYYGAAFGTTIENWILEAAYSIYKFEIDGGKTINSQYSTMTFSVGYRFAL
jgi:hypothetical protein